MHKDMVSIENAHKLNTVLLGCREEFGYITSFNWYLLKVHFQLCIAFLTLSNKSESAYDLHLSVFLSMLLLPKTY